jgi:hypothetical protein
MSTVLLEEFQNNPDVYLEDELYADVIAKCNVPFSYLTLGHYENCRIPVTAPLTPHWSIDFIL